MSALPDTAARIAAAVRRGEIKAADVVQQTLSRIAQADRDINAFTAVTTERARREAEAIDARRARGETLPPLAGVPYAVKNLFDVAGVTTLAGSKRLRSNPPAAHDAALVARLQAAGAIMVGALNMDEFAYGFTTENTHVGPTRNPRDRTRIAGGSSGGSAAAVAAGMVPLTLGSDTNGSIRVPASLCGVFGLKPTFGRLSRVGSFPFVASLDHLGPFARTSEDLVLAYDACQGPDARDPACAQLPVAPTLSALSSGIDGLRLARLTGYFDDMATDAARAVSVRAAKALNVSSEIELPHAALGRTAAFVITASEGGALHLPALRTQYADYDPHTRDRFIAGALMPAAWYLQAQRVRAWYRQHVLKVFERFDVLIAPATPCVAPPIGTEWIDINGKQFPARPSMGLLTQPISCIGLPVAVVPLHAEGVLPIGVQLIAAPWREDLCLRVAHALERLGATAVIPTTPA